MEMDQGYQLTRKGVKGYDLVSGSSLDLPETLRNLETANNIVWQQHKENNHEDYYSPLYDRDRERCLKALNTDHQLRKNLITKAFLIDSLKIILRKIKDRLLPQKSKSLTVLQDVNSKKLDDNRSLNQFRNYQRY